jgi:hypothetical protein
MPDNEWDQAPVSDETSSPGGFSDGEALFVEGHVAEEIDPNDPWSEVSARLESVERRTQRITDLIIRLARHHGREVPPPER